MPNPFNRAQLSVLDARVPVERLHVCLTTLMKRICELEGGAEATPVSRAGFATDLRATSIELHRLATGVLDATAALATNLETLAVRVESGEDLSSFDVRVPWESTSPRRARPARGGGDPAAGG